MKDVRNRGFRAGKCLRGALLLALLLALCGTGAGADAWYAENGWNYVDVSMDVSRGMPEDASGVLARIERRGTLRVAMDEEEGPYTAADRQLARLIADRMGVELKIIPLEKGRVLPALLEDQCDLSVSAIAFTPGRALAYTMSRGYYEPEEIAGIGLLIREGGAVQTLEDLEGRILTAQSNSLAEAVGARRVTKYLEFQRPASVQAVFDAVEKGTADAGLVDLETAGAYLAAHPGLGLSLAQGQVFFPDEPYRGLRVAAKKGEGQLIAFVNGVLDEAAADGRYESWMEKEQTRRN